jgi:hypothetical protein
MTKDRMKKLTVLVPEGLLRKATEPTGARATPTVRMGLKLLAARRAYDRLLNLQGKVKFSLTWQEMRGGRMIVDSLIAQSCLDHDLLLVTRDRDFSLFQKLAGLRLVAHDRFL